MLIIKWEKDDYDEELLYDLYAYTETNKKIHIAMLYWNNINKYWVMEHEFPQLKPKTRQYNYNINDLNDVLFKAILDIQSDLKEIFYMCNDYNEAVSDYIIDYIQGVNQNEN